MIKLLKVVADRASEIFQSLDIKFAFVVKENEDAYKQQHLASKCRDFLGDCIWSKEIDSPVSIYGFHYTYKDTPYCLDKLQLSLTFPDKESKDCFINNFDYLQTKEMDSNIDGSTWAETDDELTLIVFADKAWQSAQWKLSLYTFYLKCFSYPTMADLQSPEDSYITTLTPEKEKVLLSYITKDVKHLHDNIHMAHNYSGFVSLLKKQNKELYVQIPELESA